MHDKDMAEITWKWLYNSFLDLEYEIIRATPEKYEDVKDIVDEMLKCAFMMNVLSKDFGIKMSSVFLGEDISEKMKSIGTAFSETVPLPIIKCIADELSDYVQHIS